MQLGIVIPALDEEESIGSVVRSLIQSLASDVELRVVVADNGSRDQTAQRAVLAGAEVISVPQKGYGNACMAAIRHLSDWPDTLLFIDADGSSSPDEASRLVTPILTGELDLTIGVRPLTEHMTLPQKLGTKLAVQLVNRIWKTSYSDMGPFRCIRKSAFDRLEMKDTTWGWTIEMQILATIHSLRIGEVPVSWNQRIAGVSKISGTLSGVVRAGLRILWTVGKYAKRSL